MKKAVLPIVVFIAILSLIGNVLAYYRYSSSRPVVTVNGKAITKKDLQDRLDLLYTRQVLTTMIWNRIIMDAASSANCIPSDADVDTAIAELERASPAVLDSARRTDPNLSLFRQQLKTNLAVRNLRMAGVTVTSADIQQFYSSHGAAFKLPKQTQTTLVLATNEVDAGTAQRLLQNGVSPGIIAQQSGLSVVGINVKLNRPLPNDVGRQVMSMSPGDVKIIPVGSMFAIVKVKNVDDSGIPPLGTIYDQVRVACILSKAPSEIDELRQLRMKAVISADVSKYASSIPVDEANSSTTGNTDSH